MFQEFKYKPRSLFFHCFYPTVDMTLDPQSELPVGLLDANRQPLPEAVNYTRLFKKRQDGDFSGMVRDPDGVCPKSGEAGYATCEENKNMHFYDFGHLEAKFKVILENSTPTLVIRFDFCCKTNQNHLDGNCWWINHRR